MMTLRGLPAPARRSARPRVVSQWSVLSCAALMLAAAVPARAADVPAPPSTDDARPASVINPGAVLTAIANRMDRDPDFVLLQLDKVTITQGEVADAIRAMPPGMGMLDYPDIYARAMDVVTRQKAMVLHAKAQHLDQDPDVLRRRDRLTERLLAETWLNRMGDAAVTEPTLRERYKRDIEGKPGPDQVHARLIVTATDEDARAVIARLQKGADFIEQARHFSKDASASAGGDIGWVTRDALAPEIGAPMFALAPGQITSYPAASIAGYFVIRVEARQASQPLTFEEAKPILTRELRTEAIKAAIGSLLTNLKFVSMRGSEPPAPSNAR